MPLFDVCLTQDVTRSKVMTIAAVDASEAVQSALELDVTDFEIDDGNCYETYVAWTEENIPDDYDICKTRADLPLRTAWSDIETDSSGLPIVWRNYYRNEAGEDWSDDWSCQCDDNGCAPYQSDWIGPEDQAERLLWESLPEGV